MSSISVLCMLMLAQEGCYLLIKAHFVSLVSTFFRQFCGGCRGGGVAVSLRYYVFAAILAKGIVERLVNVSKN